MSAAARDDEAFTDRLRGIHAIASAIDAAIRVCRKTCPARPPEPPLELFGEVSIPYEIQIAMVHRLSMQGATLYELAEEYDYPVEAVEMAMARLRGRYLRELRQKARPWQ